VDTVIRAAAADRRLCRLLARVALGEEDLRRRKLELALRFLLARFRRAPSAARRLVDSV